MSAALADPAASTTKAVVARRSFFIVDPLSDVDQVRSRRFTVPPAAAADPVRQALGFNALRVGALILLKKFPHLGLYLQKYLQALAVSASKNKAPANVAGAL